MPPFPTLSRRLSTHPLPPLRQLTPRVRICRNNLSTSMTHAMPHTPMTEVEQARYRDLQNLLAKFHDPQSPYYIPPGTKGPVDEHDHSGSRAPGPAERAVERYGISDDYERSRREASKWFAENGYDARGQLEWPVAWGDCDMFQHANNVHYVRWFESARIRYTETLDLPNDDVRRLLSGQGTGIILKDVSIKYKAPVTYPDTLYIASKPHSVDQDRASFGLASAFYSLKDNKLVATADCTLVMYDYNDLCKGSMSDTFRDALLRRIKH
ncbi:HotDog domain-containing protein [Papiliotrema laurentii]|uniref:HotDog domain-containing protein n=1 Tax=Papiliotrema laurentii TaxID=5418 RepID=A0AAD9FQ11_PAPLA|nr:HotDog domain-containing protein [Papiliotrema laurentii]